MKLAKLVVLLGLVACDNGRKQPQLPDAGKLPDAAPVPVQCLLAPTMGDVVPTEQFAYSAMPMNETAPTNYYLLADLNQEPMPDFVMVDLYKNYGAFKAAGGWPTAPVEIQITGEETDYS